jgi:hypothetical protein
MQRRFTRILMVMFCGLPLAVRAQAPKSDTPNWIRFDDPNEHAFSLDVPAGWKVQGGLVRRGPVDLSMFLRALSPDDAIMLILGDPAPAYFGTPGLGAGPKARPYLPGQGFARQYVEQSLPSVCSGLTFITGSDRPDIASGPLAQGTPYARHDAGDVMYSCTHNGKPTRAYMVAGTYLYTSQMKAMPGSWGLNLLAGCLAPADRVDAAKKMVLHMLQSAKFDPAWNRKEQALVDQATRNINAITAAQQRAFDSTLANAKAQQAAMRQEYNDFNNVQTQTGTFVDSSGHIYNNVQNTQNYHWVAPGGKTAETSGPTPPPGSGWTQLKQVPTQ